MKILKYNSYCTDKCEKPDRPGHHFKLYVNVFLRDCFKYSFANRVVTYWIKLSPNLFVSPSVDRFK